MSYFQLEETRNSSQLQINLGKNIKAPKMLIYFIERMHSTNLENEEGYETCSQQYLNVAEKFDNNMKLIRNIEPDKKSLENQLKKCKEEL